VVREWVKDSHITLNRNPRFWGTRPALNTVSLQYVTSAPQAVSLLKGGDLDVITSVLPRDVKSLSKSGYQVIEGQSLFTHYVSMNEDAKWPFHSADVRRAVKNAIDYDGITKQLLGGTAVRAGGVIGKGLLGYDESLNTKYQTNVDTAKSLLRKGGFSNGFSVDLYYQNDAPVNGVPADTIAAKLQADLAKVGIKVTLRGQPSATVFPQYRSGSLPMVFWFFGPTYPDPDVIMSPHGDYNTQATTRVHYRNTAVTKLIRQARVTVDRKKRQELYVKAQGLVAQNGPYAFMFRPLAVSVARKGVTFPYVPIWTVDLARASAS
jgi:peptide/nickel transport system substrate-binding protein